MTDVCIAGINGRMGRTVAVEALKTGFNIVGAVESPGSEVVGKTLAEAGIMDSPVKISPPEDIALACGSADVYISFTSPKAEMMNLPLVSGSGIPIVMGTTGLTGEEMNSIAESIREKVPAVIASNFAVGVNMLYRLVRECGNFPQGYDFSIVENHHTGKKDSPSGTAKTLGDIISEVRGYSQKVHGRNGFSPRRTDELEIVSVRTGGVPGIHEVIVSGSDEMIRIEHISFSRSVFAKGALYCADWICRQERPGVYDMEDVLNNRFDA